MIKAYKYRLYPNRLQEEMFERHLELTRELYNAALEERRSAWKKSRVSRSFFDQKKELPAIKEARPEFAAEVHAHVLQGTLQRLDKAFKGFFKRCKEGKTPGFPRFKGKGWWDSFAYQECSTPDGQGWKWTTCGRPDAAGKRINLPKIGMVKVTMHRPLQGRPKTLMIKREGTEWYAVYACEVEEVLLPPAPELSLGIDLGTRYLYTDSQGHHEPHPRHLERSQRKIAKHSRKLARQKRASKRRKETKRCLGKLHQKVKRQRLDHAHKLAKKLVEGFQAIVHEDLKPEKMVHLNSSLSRSIHDAGWSQLISILSFKAASAGRTVIKVDPSHTSQRCHGCGYIDRENRSGERFRCLSCGHVDHADRNAALNIEEKGMDPAGYEARSHRARIGREAEVDQGVGGQVHLLRSDRLEGEALSRCFALQGGE